MNEKVKNVLKGISHTGYTTEIERTEARLLIEDLYKENQKLKKQLEVGKEQYNDVVEEKEKYKETVDKAIHLLEQFDAWLEPQDFLKIKKIEKVLEEVKDK